MNLIFYFDKVMSIFKVTTFSLKKTLGLKEASMDSR